MGQLGIDVAELKKGKGKLPSDTQVNPSHGSSRGNIVNVNQVSVLRSGKEFKANLSPGFVEGVVEDITGDESENDETPPVLQKESNVKKPEVSENEKNENEPSQVPFPSALLDPGKKNLLHQEVPKKKKCG